MKLWYICIILTCSSACLTGANTQSLWKKNKKQTWATAKKDHVGKYLSELDLHAIKKASNESHFNEALKNVLIVRVVDTTGHTKVRQYIGNQMQRLGWTVEEHVFKDETPLGTKTFRNIIATLNPSATRFLVVACHYDSKITPKGFLGATDSAVPCAMMINLAYTLFDGLQSHKLSDNELTLRFIFFDGEEALRSWTSKDSLYGSRKLAELMAGTSYPPGNREDTTELDRIDLFVLLDLLGASNCNFRNFPLVNVKKWYEVFVNLERNTNLSTQPRKPLFSDRNIFGKIEDDHIPFLERGVQILHLISYPFPKAWHELGDNFNSLDFNVIETLNNLVRAFVVHYLHVNL